MRWRPLRWLLGLPFLALLGLIGLYGELPHIQDDLGDRAGGVLQSIGHSWAKLEFDGRDARVTGSASTEQEQQSALDAIRKTWGVRVVTDETSLIQALTPYTWTLTRDGRNVEVDGFAANDLDRNAVGEAAASQLRGLTVRQSLKLARGMPDRERWLAAVGFASAQMAMLTKGQAKLTDLNLAITGTASTPDSYDSILRALKAQVPEGLRISRIAVLPPEMKPFTWSAAWKDRQLSLEGFVPEEDAHRQILGRIEAEFPDAKTIDHLKIASGEPEGFAMAAVQALSKLSRLDRGMVHISDHAAEISGVAIEQDTAEATAASFRSGMPAGFEASAHITFEKARIPLASPFAWSAQLLGNSLDLGGFVPDDKVKAAIASYASSKFPGTHISDHTTVARGAAAGFEQAARLGLDQLARCDRGAAKLLDSRLEFNCHAREAGSADALRAAILAALPSGYASSVDVEADKVSEAPPVKPAEPIPYTWSAQLAGKSLDLGGFVPDEKTRAGLLSAANARFGGIHISDHMAVAHGAPAGFEQTAKVSLDQLALADAGAAKLNGSMLEFNGHAKEPAIADAMRATILAALPNGFTSKIDIEADKQAVIAPAKPPEPAKPAGPYLWDADLSNGTLTLSGGAPGPENRDLVLRLISSRLPGVTVVNRMTLVDANPAPEDDWLHTIDAGLKALADLGGGRAHLANSVLTVTGTTSDRAMPDHIAETLRRSLPTAYRSQASVDYVAPPAPQSYVTTLKYDGLKLGIEGQVPDEASKNQLLARLRQLFPDRDFDDRAKVAPGAPAGWLDALMQAVGPLSNLDAGQLTLRDQHLYLSGTTEDEKVLAAARQKVSSGLPKGFAGDDQLTYVAPPAPDPKLLARRQDESKYNVGQLMKQNKLSAPECQAVLNSLLRGKLFFAFGRADLNTRSAWSLGPVITFVKRCPATRVEISGHTDSDGAPLFNQRLSERRAQAVVRYLIQKGLPANRLSAVGYGQTRPIAPNDNATNKAKNRRIEFDVTPG